MDEKYKQRIDTLRQVKQISLLGGGQDKLDKMRERGKLTARERIEYLLDEGSFVEHNLIIGYKEGMPYDGLIAGFGKIHGRTVCVYSQDPTVSGGSVGPMHGFKMYRAIEWALDMGVPLIGAYMSPPVHAYLMQRPRVFSGRLLKETGVRFFTSTPRVPESFLRFQRSWEAAQV